MATCAWPSPTAARIFAPSAAASAGRRAATGTGPARGSGRAPMGRAWPRASAAPKSGRVPMARACAKTSAVPTSGGAPTAAVSQQAPAARARRGAPTAPALPPGAAARASSVVPMAPASSWTRAARVSANAPITPASPRARRVPAVQGRRCAMAAALTPASTSAALTRSAGVIPCVATATVAMLACIVAGPPAVSTEGGERAASIAPVRGLETPDGNALRGATRARRRCGAPLPRLAGVRVAGDRTTGALIVTLSK